MGFEMKVEIIHQETIKPSSSTPPHLTSSDLSLFDQLMPEVYTPLVFFYPSTSEEVNIDHRASLAKRSKLLKTSLSEALTHFYNLAGEFKYNDSINCNDQGAAFLEAQVNCPITKIFGQPDLGMQNQLLPNGMEYMTQSGTRYLLLVQANFFECGGLAVGVRISHKVVDAYTISEFMTSWAAIARGASTSADIVLGAAAQHFPPQDFFNSLKQPSGSFVKEKCVARRFKLEAPKIAALKSKAASATVPNPTRVEVVTALIWKCAMEASRSNLGFVRPSTLHQSVNLRKILVQHSTESVIGNFVSTFTTKTKEREVDDHDDIQSLVAKLRSGLEEFKLCYGYGMTGEDVIRLNMEYAKDSEKDDVDSYLSISWCRFPFYSTDFGWGRPSWVVVPAAVEAKNITLLMDADDGIGIEANITLKEEDMALFETNRELLTYASLNPSIVM